MRLHVYAGLQNDIDTISLETIRPSKRVERFAAQDFGGVVDTDQFCGGFVQFAGDDVDGFGHAGAAGAGAVGIGGDDGDPAAAQPIPCGLHGGLTVGTEEAAGIELQNSAGIEPTGGGVAIVAQRPRFRLSGPVAWVPVG